MPQHSTSKRGSTTSATDAHKCLAKLSGLSPRELRQELAAVLAVREALRDEEMERLEQATAKVLAHLADLEHAKVVEEGRCLRDLLALTRAAQGR